MNFDKIVQFADSGMIFVNVLWTNSMQQIKLLYEIRWIYEEGNSAPIN